MEKSEQINMLGEIDARDRMRIDQIRMKLREEYHHPKTRDWPDGLVMILEPNYGKIHFYRAVVGYHQTIGGPHVHLVSRPNDEWPELPPWQTCGHKRQWIYPDGCHYLPWTKDEFQTGGGDYDE